MTGYITVREPQIVTLASEQEAYDLISDMDAGFDPEEDLADAKSAEYVHAALQRMLGEHDGSEHSGTYGASYHRNWIIDTMSAISERWGV